MVEEIGKILTRLGSSSYTEAKEKISIIRETFNVPLNGAQLDYAISTLFAEENGIISYIRKKFKNKDFESSIVDAFNLLAYLILQNFKKRLESYIVDIKKVCMYCIVLDQPPADQKENAFEVLQAIFGKSPWQKDLEVSDLIDRLLRQIICKKPTPKVLAKEYHLLGIIARKHPDHMLQRSTEILRLFFSDLDYQTSETPNVSFPLIEGCLNGLTEFLYSFTQSPEDSPENCEKIYMYLMKLSLANPKELTRRTALRAALNLLAKHGSQISVHLYKDYKHWHEYFNTFLTFGREDVKVAMSALSTYYEQVMANLQSSEIHDRCYVMQYFMKFFKDKLLSHNIRKQEQHIVIKAFGMFAAPCHLFTSQNDVWFMFLLTVQKAKEIYQKREELKFMADYVTSLSSIVVELESMPPDQIASLEQVIVMLIEAFPDLPASSKPSAVRAVAGALCSVASRGSSAMDGLFTTVVYQGVLRTCSHPVALDVELQKERISNNDTCVSYKHYVMLWTGLLQLETYKPGLSLSLRHSVINKIYDEFVSTVVYLCDKLNLETKTKTPNPNKDDDFPALDPRVALEAVVPRDFQVFINLCDLCRDVLMEKNLADLFRRWVLPFCHSLVRHIYRRPLVSGFYKLLTVALQLCDKLHFFKDFPSATEDSRMPCYLLLTKCLSDLTCRVQQYKGDLQVACIQTILASPVQLVDKFIQQTQSAFQVSFHLGHSNIALAHLALSTLERWYNLLPASKMKLLLKVVLPDLDAYLRSMGIDDQANTDTLEVRSTTRKNSVKSFARRKNLLERPETELLKLQRHILMFLGQLDTDTSSALIEGRETECVSWDSEYHLIYAIPFQDMKVPVNLDKFLPRVVDLALSCSNRQTRVAACEFLHAVVMYMLGTNWTQELSKPGHLSKLFEKLMIPLLRLGCDSDQVVYQLFNPLVPQLAHWYSSRMQIRSKHTEIFLHALMDGITHPSDTAVQDYSAKCLHEFVVWSIKQSSLKEQSNVNIKAVLKMMCSFCTHPSPVKRLGGALVFNSTYRVLREEESILDQYWLELLYYLVCNLKLADTFSAEDTNTAEQVALALDHITRVLVEKAPLFCKTSKNRRVPSEFSQGQLEDAVDWLLKQCGSLQPECQRKCMELVSRLAPLLPEYGSAANFLRHQDVFKLHEICNGNKITDNVPPTGALLSQINIWLDEFLASLKCYLWLIGERLLSPQDLFNAENSIRLFRVAEYFVEQVASKNASNMVSFLGGKVDVISIVEEEYFDCKKCSVVLNLIKLASAILRSAGNLPSTLLDFFTSTAFVQFVASCTFCPLSLGFNMRNVQLLEALPKTVENFLDATCRQEKVYKSILGELRIRYSASQTTLLADLTASMTSRTVSEPQVQFIQGLKTLQTCRLLSLIGCQLDGEELINVIVSALIDTTHGSRTMIRLEPAVQIFAESVLKLSFLLGDQVEVLVRRVLDETCLQKEVSLMSCLGDHFLSTFRSAVLDQFLCHEEKSVDHFLSGSVDSRSLNVIAQLLQHLLRTKHEIRHRCSATIKKVLVCHWDALVHWASASPSNTVLLLGILCDLVASLQVVVGSLKEPAALAEWVASQINSRQLQQLQRNRALDLLPCLTGPDEDENLLVKSALQEYKDENIPLHSSELSPSSLEYSGFISAFNTILMSLELSGSRILLYGVISMTAGDPKHICEENIQTTLRFFISGLQPDNQVKALEVPYSIFTSRIYDPTIRHSAALRFCRTMLQACCVESLRSFMVVHVQQLLRYALQTGLDNKQLEAEHQLVERVGAWAVFELLFCRLEQREIESPDSQVTQAAFPKGAVKTGKELLVELTKRSCGVRKENIPASLASTSNVIKLFREYQCAAYNALISIISNSKRDKDDLKFYYNFLFLETESKGQIWSKIVDCSHKIVFSMDWAELPAKRKKMVAIRRSNVDTPTGGVQYLQTGTQMLFDSTLREDVTSFDFSLSVLKSRQASSQTDRESSMVVMLEIDSINEHECMASLCGLLQHLVEQKISPPPGDSPAALPSWMEAIKKSLEDENNAPNARLFILKLILNCESLFRPYAKFWFTPIMKALLNRCAGSSINYMFTDIVAMMLEWHDVAIPNSSDIEKHLASEILSFFMSNTESSRRDVFKYSVDVVKTIVEQWKPCLVVPYQLLLDKLNPRSNADSVNNEVGLHLVAVLLVNGIEPWNSAGKKLFFEYLISNLDSNKSNVYLSCAQVVGMTLKILGASGSSDLTEDASGFLQQTECKLMIMKEAASNLNKFVHCLHSMGEHCSLVVKQFATFINHKVHRLSGTMQVKCLQMIGWWPEAASEFVATGIKDFLTSHNPDIQEAALTAVSQIAHQLDTPQLMVLVPDIVVFVLHQSASCRLKMFNILMWVYDKYNENSSQEEILLFEKSRTTLIRGLVDADASVQNAVYRFWNNSTRLPMATSQRLVALMKNLYSPTTEDLLTTCLAHLLLHASKLSPDHEAKLFDYPLGDCQFEKYPMLISWRAQHTTMAPLFADTLASQLHSQDLHSVNMVLRATQESLAFKPTVDFTDEANVPAASTSTFSSLNSNTLFTLGSNSRLTSEFSSKGSQLHSGFAKPETTKSFLKRRFLKNANDIREGFARREMNRNLRRQEMQQESVRRREATVSMYRSYRIGDLPDIEILHSALIEPLQALAKQDSSVACQVVVELFLGLSNGVQDKEMFMREAEAVMNYILQSTVQCCPPVVETVLKMVLPNTDYIHLHPGHLSAASRPSGLFSLGALVLENMLLSASEEAEIPTKRARMVESVECELWLQLAELYSGLDEWDVVHGVFSDKLNCTEAMKDALVAESSRNWHFAQSKYLEAINKEDTHYRDYCRQAFYKCLSHLSKWEELRTNVHEELGEDLDSLWKDEWNQEKVLPWFLTSELQLNIFGQSGDSACNWPMVQTVQGWLEDSEKAYHLKCNYSEVLAMMWLLKEDYGMSRHHAVHSMNMFLVSWAHVNPLAHKRRVNLLLTLSRAVEMHTYLALATVKDKEDYQLHVKNLLDRWSNSVPSEWDSLDIWDQRIAYRVGFAKQIEDQLNLLRIGDDSLFKQLAATKMEMELTLVDAALSQRNFYLARTYLQRTKVMLNSTRSQIHVARWTLYFSHALYLRADQEEEQLRKFHWIMEAWKELDTVLKMAIPSHRPLLAKAYQHQSVLSQEIMSLISRDAARLLSSTQPKFTELLDQLSLTCHSGTDVILNKLKHFGLGCLEKAIKIVEDSAEEKEMAEAYFNIAQYCRSEAMKEDSGTDSSHLDHSLVQSVLRAMKFGSRAARQLFPCVLQLPGLKSVHRDIFITESAGVPEWMFLAWVSQILARVDTDNVLEEVILRVVKTYPQAVVFPFNISCSKYTFANNAAGRESQALVHRVKKILHRNPLLETFVEALTYLAPQRLILKYHLNALKTCLSEVPFDHAKFCEKLIVALKESFRSAREKPRLHGSLFALQEFRERLVNITGLDGSKVNARNIGNVQKHLRDLEAELSTSFESGTQIISDYCPWLGEFQTTKFSDEIEIPGQYTGEKQPLPHLHAKVVSFAKHVNVMKSKCCPVQITINGSNAKEYKFLVKFGEDLRQDQRIQQLFRLMNEILARDMSCCHRSLSLLTYSVVPLNSRVGIIQWVDNTETLDSVFKMKMTAEESAECGKIIASYDTWIRASSKAACNSTAEYYKLAYDKYTRGETVAKFTELAARLPWNILRRSLESLSISPEAFFTLRHNFASSYATMCACHWLLGVGDRHLCNCLVSVKDASCVGIDFGHSFGTATQFLQVPELFPFRLTPHIVSLLRPFEQSGIFFETMVCVLRAMRSNRDMLLATMEIFVHEPSLDWLEFARRQDNFTDMKDKQKETKTCQEKWYPLQKLLLARKKLQGANPAAITLEELRSRNDDSKRFEDVARGEADYNVRARMDGENLSPEDQVCCLLDQATDYHILGKTWRGWQPWM